MGCIAAHEPSGVRCGQLPTAAVDDLVEGTAWPVRRPSRFIGSGVAEGDGADDPMVRRHPEGLGHGTLVVEEPEQAGA
jgi:hypothetical protein